MIPKDLKMPHFKLSHASLGIYVYVPSWNHKLSLFLNKTKDLKGLSESQFPLTPLESLDSILFYFNLF